MDGWRWHEEFDLGTCLLFECVKVCACVRVCVCVCVWVRERKREKELRDQSKSTDKQREEMKNRLHLKEDLE